MKKYFDILRRCPLFHGMDERDLSAMLGCLGARVTRAAKNEIIFLEGDPAQYVGILLTGGAQIVRSDYYGSRSIVARVEPGELFGESFACAGVTALPVSVVATGESEIMLLDCRRITHSCAQACEFHSWMIYNLLKVVAAKNLVFHQKIEITSKRTTREKLMTYLLAQAKLHNSRTFTIPYDRQALADYLEVDRSGLSAEIGRLRREGVLESRKSVFTLL